MSPNKTLGDRAGWSWLALAVVLTLTGSSALGSMAMGQDLFPDKNLEAVVRQQVFEKRNNTMLIVEADVQNIAILHGNGKKITNLAGLEKCRSLREVKLGNNEITDITPLKDLKEIQSLHLQKNKITSVAPLAELTALQYLDLSNNQVADIAPLAKFAALGFLELTNNQVKDIAVLGGLKKLHALYLDSNPVADIKPLAALKGMERLGLRNTGVADLAPLAEMTELSFLFLEGNKITDLGVLLAMAKKDVEGQGPKRFAPYLKIYLKGNPLAEAAQKTQLPELQKLVKEVKLD